VRKKSRACLAALTLLSLSLGRRRFPSLLFSLPLNSDLLGEPRSVEDLLHEGERDLVEVALVFCVFLFFLGRVGEIFPLSVFSRRAADDQPLLPPARSELAVASFFELALSRRIALALSLLPLETLAVPRDGAGIDFPHHPRSKRGNMRGARIEIRPRRNSSAPLTRGEREMRQSKKRRNRQRQSPLDQFPCPLSPLFSLLSLHRW